MSNVIPTQGIPERPPVAQRLTLRGCVQGMGVRPSLHRWATRLGLAGNVRNTPAGVVLELEGPPDAIATFVEGLEEALPAGCRVEAIYRETTVPRRRSGFTIQRAADDGPVSARVPPDVAVCRDCLDDVFSAAGRRRDYGLTTCARCGPRFSVIRAMPFERPDTALAEFALCEPCRREYTLADDRRFHAQTIGCPSCGPQVWAVAAGKRPAGRGGDAVRAAGAVLRSGSILALRGVGGYQLLVDATDEDAVGRLRARKRRPSKPLAVMVDSLESADRFAWLNPAANRALQCAANPIVVVRAKDGALPQAVHPELGDVGLMLPTTPLHAQLLREAKRPLVCTSGNREGEPLEFEIAAAEKHLSGIADMWLHHDRPIAHPIDDSVVRVIADRPVTLRLARGMAPLPLEIPRQAPMLATGGHLKCAPAWSNGAQAVLGPHVGDQETLASRQRYIETIRRMQRLYRFEPVTVVHDAHPEYFTSDWARGAGPRRISAQHHHAHVVAGMIEHGWLDRQVLGVAWDGTGYGSDGTIWGGEFLLAAAGRFRRVARLRPFCLPGGDAAASQPWRVAAAMVQEADSADAAARFRWRDVDPSALATVLRLASRRRLAPTTSSAGRLFDAAACMILGIERVDYEGQAAACLESACDPAAEGRYRVVVREAGDLLELDWRPLVAQLLSDLQQGEDRGTMATRFHRGVARAIADVCRRFPELPIVLGGGVFQNRVLTELLVEMLGGRRLGLPGAIPPGDGGLAAGQLAVATMQAERT